MAFVIGVAVGFVAAWVIMWPRKPKTEADPADWWKKGEDPPEWRP